MSQGTEMIEIDESRADSAMKHSLNLVERDDNEFDANADNITIAQEEGFK